MAQPQIKFTDPIPEWSPELEDIKRREEMAKALLAQSKQMPQGQMVSGRYVRPSITESLARVLQGAMAGRELEGLTAQKRKLADEERAAGAAGVQEYLNLLQGKPAVTEQFESPVFADRQPRTRELSPAVPGDKRAAIAYALGNRHPLVQQLGIAELSRGPELSAKDVLAHADPRSIPAMAARGISGFQPKRELKEAGGQFFDLSGDQPRHLGGLTFENQMAGGDTFRVQQQGNKWEKLDQAPKISLTASPVIQGQKAGMSEFFKNAAGQVDALGKSAQAANATLQGVAQLRSLDKQGLYSNLTSGPATFLANLAQSLGATLSPAELAKLKNTETFNAVSVDLWQTKIAEKGGNRGVTQEEAKKIMEMLPLAKNSPQAREQIYTILEQAAARTAQHYRGASKAFGEAVTKDDPTVFTKAMEGVYLPEPIAPTPVQPTPVEGTAMSPQEYLRKFGGGR